MEGVVVGQKPPMGTADFVMWNEIPQQPRLGIQPEGRKPVRGDFLVADLFEGTLHGPDVQVPGIDQRTIQVEEYTAYHFPFELRLDTRASTARVLSFLPD